MLECRACTHAAARLPAWGRGKDANDVANKEDSFFEKRLAITACVRVVVSFEELMNSWFLLLPIQTNVRAVFWTTPIQTKRPKRLVKVRAVNALEYAVAQHVHTRRRNRVVSHAAAEHVGVSQSSPPLFKTNVVMLFASTLISNTFASSPMCCISIPGNSVQIPSSPA